jgi:UDP-glucose 4-epimerase
MSSGIEFISFRLANIYGPRNLSGPLPTFYQRLSQNKECFVIDTRRDFVYIDDLLVVILKALDGQGKNGIYHISSGKDYAIKEIFDAIVKAMGIKLKRDVEIRPRNPNDAYTILLDPSKTNQDFRWQATTSLDKGVRMAIEWYQTHQFTETFTHLKDLKK